MVVGTHRATKLLIDRQAIRSNISQQLAKLTPGTALFAVVKANGYGHGLIEVAKTALSAGASGFCVAILDEGLALREAGLTQPILVLGITDVAQASLAADYDISLSIGSVDWLKRYQQQVTTTKPLKVHLALDTGMGRIGFRQTDELTQAVALVRQTPFNFEGVFTHFATADEADERYFKLQFTNWQKLVATIDPLPRFVHVSNSATGMWHTNIAGNLVRMGISLYGQNPSGTALTPSLSLHPALSLVSEINFVKSLKKGDCVSYGATYQAQQDEWIGTIPIGYADGYPRAMQGFHVLIDGQFCEIVGRVCMDQMMVRLPHQLPVGTAVTLIGQQGEREITVTQIADYVGTINYEILTGLAPRLDRQYLN